MRLVLNAALPVFGLILTGFLAGRSGMFDKKATDALNLFASFLALPALLFLAMARMHPDEARQLGFTAAFALGIVGASVLGFAWSRVRGRRFALASVEGLDAGYSNVGYMGIPLVLLVFGPQGLPTAVIATLLTACVSFLITMVLIESDLYRGGSLVGTARKVAWKLLRSPLLLAPLAGILVALAGLELPQPVAKFAEFLGGAASPVALVCIGLFLAQEHVTSGDFTSIFVLAALKLLIQPGITAILVWHVFAVPPLWGQAAVLLSALPTGSGPFLLAKLYGLEAGITSGTILLSHLASIATLSLLLAWLS